MLRGDVSASLSRSAAKNRRVPTFRRLARFIAKRHQRRKRYGWWVLTHQAHGMGLIELNGTIVPPGPTRPGGRGVWKLLRRHGISNPH